MSLKAREERFAVLVVEGLSKREAYRQAYGITNPKQDLSKASKLAKREDVAAYIERLTLERAGACPMTLDELINKLSYYVRVSVVEDADLSFKTITKKDAIVMLIGLMGWNTPQKLEVKSQFDITQIIEAIRDKGEN